MNLRDGSAPAFVMHLFFISRFMVKENSHAYFESFA